MFGADEGNTLRAVFTSFLHSLSYSCICALDRVVVRSRAQIVKPDAVFVVFLGIKWAHSILEKNRS